MSDNPHYVRTMERRILGRVFTFDDMMHFVVAVDDDAGLAQCNRRGTHGIDAVLMPAAEVVLRLGWEQEAREREQMVELAELDSPFEGRGQGSPAAAGRVEDIPKLTLTTR